MTARRRARGTRRLAVAAVAGLAVLALAWSLRAPSEGRLDGRVIDAADEAIARARVSLMAGDVVRAETYTDGRGRFSLALDDSADRRLQVVRAGFATQELDRADAPGSRRTLVVRLQRGATIAGTVVDAAGDAVIAPVFLVGEPTDSRHAAIDRLLTTDDRGAFRFGSLPAGRYRLYLEAPAAVDADETEPLHWGLRSPVAPAVELTLGAGDHRDLDALEPRHADGALSLAFSPDEGVGQAQAGGPPRRGGAIEGQVVDPDGRPVAGASVLLEPVGDGRSQRARTGAGGRYRMANVSDGTYSLIAVKGGHLAAQYGWMQSPQHGRTLSIASGETFDHADIVLPRAGAIEGTVADEAGVPVEGLLVEAFTVRPEHGRPTLVPAPTARTATTDDRGRYRIHGLLPGAYYVAATDDRPGLEGTFPRQVFHPGTLVPAGDRAVHVALGDDVRDTGIVFDTTAWPHLPMLRGRMVGASGDPVPGTVTLARWLDDGEVAPPARTTRADDEGRFDFGPVPPGEYVLHAVQAGLSAFPRASAREVISMEPGATAERTLTVTAGTTVLGEVVLDGETAPHAPSAFRVSAVAAGVNDAPVHPDLQPWALVTPDDVVFELGGLQGSLRLVADRVPPGWWLESAIVDGINAAVDPVRFGPEPRRLEGIRVVFSGRTGTAAGLVTDRQGQPVPGAAIVIFPSDRARWFARSPFVRRDTSGPDGRFVVDGLPPGDYLAAAAMEPGLDERGWLDSTLLERLAPDARVITITPGVHATVELTHR